MEIKIDTDNELPLNKLVNFLTITVTIRSAFEEDSKYYSQIFQMNVYMSYENVAIRKINISEEIDTNKAIA